MRDILLQRDTDCGDCLGGDHCLKCLFLDPKRRDTFKPPKAEIWLTGDLDLADKVQMTFCMLSNGN